MRERAKLWPDPLTWEWFLGDRCKDYSRAECVEFLSVAIAFMQSEKINATTQLPCSVRELWIARRNSEKPVLLAALAALGVVLDLWELGDRQPPDEELTAALIEYVTAAGLQASSSGGELEAGIIESVPADEAPSGVIEGSGAELEHTDTE